MDSDWFELCPPKGNHPPAEMTWGPGEFVADVGNQQFHIPRLRITTNPGSVSLDPTEYILNIPPAGALGLTHDRPDCAVTFPTVTTTNGVSTLNMPREMYALARTGVTAVALPDGAWTQLVPTSFDEYAGDGGQTFFTTAGCLTIPACVGAGRYFEIHGLLQAVVDTSQVDLRFARVGIALVVDGTQWYKTVSHFDDAGEAFIPLRTRAIFVAGMALCIQAYVQDTNGFGVATIADIGLWEERGI